MFKKNKIQKTCQDPSHPMVRSNQRNTPHFMNVGWIGVVGSESRRVGSGRLDRILHCMDPGSIDGNHADRPEGP